MQARQRVGLTHRFLAWRALAAGANLRDRRAGMVRLAPVVAPRERLLNFIGSMSGPVTMKSPLTSRMVSVVIETPRWARQNAHRNDPSLNPS